ncbi:MAG: RNA-binding protein [Gammaproteobacteria bacterium]|nr:RNA-binding protein [Gammaproteobacteria bacterium]
MPKGPNGEKRPADVVGCATTVAKIATGEFSENKLKCPGRHASGVAGGKARAKSLSKARRKQIAKKAAEARWSQ